MPPKFDPYATLGVPPDAPKDEVRKAYRRRARRAHPDAGGSAEEFAKVQRAHLLLTDETRRAKYDATGEADEATVDNAVAAAVQKIVATLDMQVQKLVVAGYDMKRVDLHEATTSAIRAGRDQLSEALGKMRRHAEAMKLAATKMKRKKKGSTVVLGAIEHRVGELYSILTKAEVEIKVFNDALAMLAEYSFDVDVERRPQQLYGSFFGGVTNAT
jgi:curved DNA-binding protein CbpA